MASDVIAPVPVTVRTPFLSIIHVTLLPSPSAPQVPLAAMSAAKAAGTSASIRLRTSRMLRSFFFMCVIPFFFG